MHSGALLSVAALALSLASPAAAEVVESSPAGFVVSSSADIAAAPLDIWTVLRSPARWWSAEHSWSGDAANFWLDAQAGGCFCETLPGDATTRGSVRHATIIYAKPGEMLRLSGALGPLQGEAVTGTLSIALVPEGAGTRVQFEYVVGGYARADLEALAPVVDAVIAQQLRGLKAAAQGEPSASPEAPAQ